MRGYTKPGAILSGEKGAAGGVAEYDTLADVLSGFTKDDANHALRAALQYVTFIALQGAGGLSTPLTGQTPGAAIGNFDVTFTPADFAGGANAVTVEMEWQFGFSDTIYFGQGVDANNYREYAYSRSGLIVTDVEAGTPTEVLNKGEQTDPVLTATKLAPVTWWTSAGDSYEPAVLAPLTFNTLAVAPYDPAGVSKGTDVTFFGFSTSGMRRVIARKQS